MSFLDAMHAYFRGEKQAGIALAVIGIALCAFAFWVWRTQTGSFAWGLIIPLSLIAIGGAIGGTVLALKTDGQVAAIEAGYREDAGALREREAVRMQRVNANWPRLKIAWGAIALVALGLLLATNREWAHGLGLALIFATALLFFVDVFAERRAQPYTEALDALRAEHTHAEH
jgi:hypothetical protein